MEVLEITLLILAYTIIVITLFLEIICYKRNIEILETIFFTASLLLLIGCITMSYFFSFQEDLDHIDIFTLIAMVLVGLTVTLNALEERIHSLKASFKRWLIIFSAALILLVVIAFFTQWLRVVEYVVVMFLGLSVVFSMILIRTTKPKMKIAHREKIERITALASLILIPLSLVAIYMANLEGSNLRIGFTIPLVFILLAGSKLWDDVQRLSLFKPENMANEQNLKNYSFTNRETEVVLLLVKGATYKEIAEQLFISIPTVKTHVSNIYKKCKVHNKAALISLLIN